MRAETPEIIRIFAVYPELKTSGVPIPSIAEQCAARMPPHGLPEDMTPADVAERACESLLLRLRDESPPTGPQIANYVVGAFRKIAIGAYVGESKPTLTSRVQQAEFLRHEAEQIDLCERYLAANRKERAARPAINPRELAERIKHARATLGRPPFAGPPQPPPPPWQPSGAWNEDHDSEDARGRGAAPMGALLDDTAEVYEREGGDGR